MSAAVVTPELIFGPYRVPPLRKGDRATCLFRDREVIITSWTDAPISWPRCRPVDGRSAPWLLVEDELARAICNESALALRYWWGVTRGVASRWRKAFGIEKRNGTEGSQRLIQAAAKAGGAVMAAREFTVLECEERRQRAIEQNYGAFLTPGYHGPWWTEEELELLGTHPDDQVAELTGRTTEAVRIMRTRNDIRTAHDRRRRS
jgi:hypothetical protein